jgi:hypothetical protein
MSEPSPRWAHGCLTGVLGPCWTTSFRSGRRRWWRPSGSEPCGSARRLECQAAAPSRSTPAVAASSITLSIDAGHIRAVPTYQVRTFEIIVAQASNDNGKHMVFASVPDEAYHQAQQLRGVLHDLGAIQTTPVTILSDGADGPRAVGEAASLGPTRHVLDCFHLAMRIHHVAQAVKGWPDDTAENRAEGARLPMSSRRTSAGGCGTGRCSGPST